MTKWKEFKYKGYTGVAVWFHADEEQSGEWVGEFNYPIRRVEHAFFGEMRIPRSFGHPVHAHSAPDSISIRPLIPL